MNVGDKLDVLAEKNPPLHDWENPDWSILDDRRGNLPDFPLDCLGGKLKEWVERAANGAGVTAAHVSVPALGIASSLIGMARRVKASKSWLEPMTCWTGIVGASGTGKTPGIDTIKRVLAQIERDGRKKIDELRRAHDGKAENAKAARSGNSRLRKRLKPAFPSRRCRKRQPIPASSWRLDFTSPTGRSNASANSYRRARKASCG